MRGFLTKTDVLRKPNRKVRGKGSAWQTQADKATKNKWPSMTYNSTNEGFIPARILQKVGGWGFLPL